MAANNAGTSSSSSTIRLQPADQANNSRLITTFIPTSNGYYQTKNANSGLDLNVSGAHTDNGALIVQYAHGSQGNDQWLPSRQSDGSYVFYNRNSGLLLDLPGFSTQIKTQLDQYGANGGANQHFNCIPR